MECCAITGIPFFSSSRLDTLAAGPDDSNQSLRRMHAPCEIDQPQREQSDMGNMREALTERGGRRN